MGNKVPLKFDFDADNTPSAVAEFTASDVVSASDGGTGFSSLALFATNLSSLDILASSVSATNVSAVHLSAVSLSATTTESTFTGSLTGPTVSATAVSAVDVLATSVSATAVSGLTFNDMPYPPPFAYIQLTSDDVASSDEKHVGYSNTPTSVVSNTDDISWDDSAKNFVVKKVGTYECVGRLFFEGGSTLIELHVNVEGSPVNTANPRAHTTVDPVERTISAIFTCAVDDVVDITYEATSAQTTAAQIGTTVTIKRLK